MFVIIVSFSCINISQGSVKIQLWFGGIYDNHVIACKLFAECAGERILKICQ